MTKRENIMTVLKALFSVLGIIAVISLLIYIFSLFHTKEETGYLLLAIMIIVVPFAAIAALTSMVSGGK